MKGAKVESVDGGGLSMRCFFCGVEASDGLILMGPDDEARSCALCALEGGLSILVRMQDDWDQINGKPRRWWVAEIEWRRLTSGRG